MNFERSGCVVVCGAGAAGMAAALAVARAGADVCLIEARATPGGTVTSALIHTLGGLYDSTGAFLEGGLARSLAQALLAADSTSRPRRMGRAWVLEARPDTYQAVVRRWLAAEPRLTALYNTRLVRCERSANRVVTVEASGPDGPVRLRTRAVIDATGTAEVVRLIGPSLVEDDERPAAGGLIFTLRDVAPGALAFPGGLALVRALRQSAGDGTLPATCSQAWLDSGTQADEVYVKLFVPLPADLRERESDISREALSVRDAVVEWLRRQPGLARARLDRTGRLGVRDGGRVRGEYCLTAADVRQGRRFEDAACRACWPIEYWDPDRGLSLEYLSDGCCYEVPLRALRVRGLGNVWAAGKCLSADRYAQASARVVGTCWSMGEAAGAAAVREADTPS